MKHRLAIVASHVVQYQDPLYRLLAAQPDIDVTVFYCDRRGADAFRDRDMSATVSWDVEHLLTGYRHRFLRNLARFDTARSFLRTVNPGLVPAIMRGKFDAVLFMIGWGTASAWLGFLACLSSGTPFYLSGDSSFPPPDRTLLQRLRSMILRMLFRRTAAFMVAGRHNADYYRHYGADPRRFFLFPYAIDNERFAAGARLAPPEREAMRAQYGFRPGQVVIAFSGKLIERKDPLTLLDAFAFMRHRDRAALLFIGDGELRPELERSARGDVRFAGFVNQSALPRHYAMCDVFVLPSLYEPHGLVVNEAMACGLPVVASNRVGATGDLVRDGENGFIFPAGNARALAELLDRIVGDDELRARMAARSREIIAGWSFDADVAAVRQALARSAGLPPPDLPPSRPPVTPSDVTIVIPTYSRGAILVRTLETILALDPQPAAILVVDQTPAYPADVEGKLRAWHEAGRIRWLRTSPPSIPHAMNEGLREAKTPAVLFLDDDVAPIASIVAEHAAAYADPGVCAVVGQCLQPGEEPQHFARPARNHLGIPDLELHFNHDAPLSVRNVIAMNLSVRREEALAVGGFDENFVFVAYRFESDFALRLTANGCRIRFEPRASVRHLRIASGGTRAYGDHRTSAHPAHSAGDYYFALRHARSFWLYALDRLRRNVLTRFHATHPWTIPAKLAGELRGLLLARRLALRRNVSPHRSASVR